MLTWHIDRFARSGPICAVITFIIPVLLAVLVTAITDVENVLGILLVGSGIILIGSLAGSVVASGFGALLFGLGSVLAEVPAGILLIVGIGLYGTLIVHDLAGSFRRAPSISRGVWRTAGEVVMLVGALAAVAFGIAYLVATRATWAAIVVPFGIAAIGFAVKLAADSHVTEARQLTAKRRAQSDDEVGNDKSN